jgi:hypothetical protein
LKPIEAGAPFRDLADIHGAAKLTEIHRQKADSYMIWNPLLQVRIVEALKIFCANSSLLPTNSLRLRISIGRPTSA